MDDSCMIYSWLCLRLCDWVTDLLWLKASGVRTGLQRTDILLPALFSSHTKTCNGSVVLSLYFYQTILLCFFHALTGRQGPRHLHLLLKSLASQSIAFFVSFDLPSKHFCAVWRQRSGSTQSMLSEFLPREDLC